MFMVGTVSRWTALEEPQVKRQIQTFCVLLSWLLQGTLVVAFGHFNHCRIVGLVGLYYFPVGLIVLVVGLYCFPVGLIVLKVGLIVLKVGLIILFVYSIVCE